ncbi:MAG: hypothetical protein VYC16_09445 [Pseudomonadota bacterium]|nr:hypothetical protein [Pseudomonadota bacterium]
MAQKSCTENKLQFWTTKIEVRDVLQFSVETKQICAHSVIKRASFSTVCADDVDASARAEIKFIGADETLIDAINRRAGVDK